MKKKICFLLDKNNDWLKTFCKKFTNTNKKFNIKIYYNYSKIKNFDYVFVLGYTRILPNYFIQKNKLIMVIHESDLPKGKGNSPLQWQILKNKKYISVNLIKLSEKVDSGDIILKDKIILNGTELYDEIRWKQAKISFKLIARFLRLKKIKFKKQIGKEFFYKKRTPKDSELNPKKSIEENFNLLRIANNNDWPAFFYFKKKKYILKIFKKKIDKNNFKISKKSLE